MVSNIPYSSGTVPLDVALRVADPPRNHVSHIYQGVIQNVGQNCQRGFGVNPL